MEIINVVKSSKQINQKRQGVFIVGISLFPLCVSLSLSNSFRTSYYLPSTNIFRFQFSNKMSKETRYTMRFSCPWKTTTPTTKKAGLYYTIGSCKLLVCTTKFHFRLFHSFLLIMLIDTKCVYVTPKFCCFFFLVSCNQTFSCKKKFLIENLV